MKEAKLLKHILCYFFCALFSTISASQLLVTQACAQTDISTAVDPQQGTVRDSFVLRLSISGSQAQSASQPEFEDSPYFTLRSVGTSINHEIVNGQHSLNVEYSYTLQLRKNLAPGRYQTPGGKVSIGGDVYDIPNKTIEIIAQGTANADEENDELRIIQVVSNDTPYVGEQILYQTKITTLVDLTGGELIPTNLVGFWRESLGKQSQTQSRSGKAAIITEREVLFPTESGTITFPERTLRAEIRVPSRRAPRNRGIWDPFFGDPFGAMGGYETAQKQYFAPSIKIYPKPLPPPPITGLTYIPVGTIKVNFSMDKNTIDQGESITLKISIEGDANLRPYELPSPETPSTSSKSNSKLEDNFKAYQDTPTLTTNFSGDVLSQKKVFSMALVALKSGQIVLPQYRVVTFNPKSESYQQYLTPRTEITVRPKSMGNQTIVGGMQVQTKADNSTQKSTVSNLANDLLPQALGPATFSSKATLSHSRFFAFFITIFLFGIFTRRYTRSFAALRADPLELRKRQAYNKALSSLKSPNLDLDSFSAILPTYLREKFRISDVTITPSEAYELISKQSKNDQLAQKTRDYLSAIERDRFGGKLASSAVEGQRTEGLAELLKSLEKFVLIVIFLCFFSANTRADNPHEATDEGVQFLTLGNHYYDIGDFAKAISSYESAIDHGVNNGYIYFNLGNAYYRSESLGKAILSYRRALKQLPRDPALLANLSLARKQTKDALTDPSESDLLNPDRLLILHRHLSEHEVMLLVLILLSCGVVCLIIEPLSSRPYLKHLRYTLIAGSFLLALPLLLTKEGRTGRPTFALTTSTRSLTPAVVIAEILEAHSGDGDNFQVVFKLNTGAEVQSAEIRGNWIQIILPDGRRGWADKEKVELVE